MKRQAIRGLALFGLLAAVAASTARAQQPTPDKVTVLDHKDGTTKVLNGQLQVSPAGFQVISDKKAVTVAPDDIIKIEIGDLPGVDRNTVILDAKGKEDKREYGAARTVYQDQLNKKGNLPERSRRYLEFKKIMMANKIADELDKDKGWKEKAEACVADWNNYLVAEDTKSGWEQWPATRACTRLQIELGKYDDAARAWNRVAKNANMPPDARLEAAIQEIDLQIRGKAYSAAATAAAELLKSATGSKKERLAVYEIAAKAAADGKPLEGVDKVKAEMNKTKDPAVHAAGFSMMGELYLAAGKPRDALWMFLWVETVMNQDKDEVLKALSRLVSLFEAQMDEEQAKKYHEKIKRFRTAF